MTGRGASAVVGVVKGRRWTSAGSSVLLAMLVAGCASQPARTLESLGDDTLSGRLALRVDAAGDQSARSLSAAFDLRGNAVTGGLDLSTPLGSVLAQARWLPGEVTLKTPRGSTRYADLDAMSNEVLGEPVPLAALFDWLHGRPWPGAPSTPMNGDPKAGFAQLGWSVDLARFDAAALLARREAPPVVTLRIQLDKH